MRIISGMVEVIRGLEEGIKVEDINQEVGGVAEPPRLHPRLGGGEQSRGAAFQGCEDWRGSGEVQQRVEEGRDEEMGVESGEGRSMVKVQRGSERIREEEPKVDGGRLQSSRQGNRVATKGNGDKEIKGGGRTSSITSDSSRKRKWGEEGSSQLQGIKGYVFYLLFLDE